MKECMKDARKKHAIIFEMNPYNKTAPPIYKQVERFIYFRMFIFSESIIKGLILSQRPE